MKNLSYGKNGYVLSGTGIIGGQFNSGLSKKIFTSKLDNFQNFLKVIHLNFLYYVVLKKMKIKN